jgi:hypothetical protein
MLQFLYAEIFGQREQPASSDEINDMMLAAAHLPYSLFNVLIRHYAWDQSLEQVAAESASTLERQESLKNSAIIILQRWLNSLPSSGGHRPAPDAVK